MATANLDPNGDGTINTWRTLAGGSTSLFAGLDDYASGAQNSDTDGVEGPNNASDQMFVLLADTPSDFVPANITSIQIKSAYRLNSAGVSGTADTVALFYQIFRSDETTAITTELSKGNITSTTYAETTDTLTGTGTHTKTDWDGARLRIRQAYTVQGCADTTTRLRVTAAQVIVTYTTSTQTQKSLTGTITPAGVLTKQAQQPKASSVTPAGTLTATPSYKFVSKVTSFNIGTGAAGTTVTVPHGLGVTPKALILMWSGRTESTNAAGLATFQRGMGWSIGSSAGQNIATAATAAHNGAGGSGDLSCRSGTNGGCILTLTTGSTVDGKATVQSWDATNVVFSIVTQFGANLRVTMIALSGSDITNVACGVGTTPNTGTAPFTTDFTGLGFTPRGDGRSLLLLSCPGETVNFSTGSVIDDGNSQLGAASSASKRGVVYAGDDSGVATTTIRTYTYPGEVMSCARTAPGSLNYRSDFAAWITDGFRLQTLAVTAQAQQFGWLVIDGPQAAVLQGTTSVTGAATVAVTGAGFAPKAGLCFSARKAQSTQGSAGSGTGITYGLFDGTNQEAHGAEESNGVTTSVVRTGYRTDNVYVGVNSSGTVTALMGLQSLDSDGATFVMNDGDDQASQFHVVFLASAPSGAFTQALSSSVTAAGLLLKSIQKSLTGSSTLAGALLKQAQKPLTGTSAPAGLLTKLIAATKAGTVTGTSSLLRAASKALTGSITAAGAMLRTMARPLTGSVTAAATLRRATTKTLSGTITTAGVALRATMKALTGSVTPAGALQSIKVKLLPLTSSVTPSGILSRIVAFTRTLTGSVTGTSALTRIATLRRTLTGSITATGQLVKARAATLTSTITPSGVKTALVAWKRTLTGSVTAAGTVVKQIAFLRTGSVTAAGVLTRLKATAFTGSITATSALQSLRARLLSSLITAAGTVTTRLSLVRTLTGTVTAAGALTKRWAKLVAGTVAASGTMTALTARILALTGTITPAGALARLGSFRRTQTGTVPLSATLARTAAFQRTLTGTVTAAATLVRQSSRFLSSVVTAAGAFAKTAGRRLTLLSAVAATGSLLRLGSYQRTLTSAILASGTLVNRFRRFVLHGVVRSMARFRGTPASTPRQQGISESEPTQRGTPDA